MYGINNNTGSAYSQQNNNISRLNRGATNADRGAGIANNLMNGINAIKKLQNGSGAERGQGIAEIAQLIMATL